MTASRRSLLVTGALAGIDISWASPRQQLVRIGRGILRICANVTLLANPLCADIQLEPERAKRSHHGLRVGRRRGWIWRIRHSMVSGKLRHEGRWRRHHCRENGDGREDKPRPIESEISMGGSPVRGKFDCPSAIVALHLRPSDRRISHQAPKLAAPAALAFTCERAPKATDRRCNAMLGGDPAPVWFHGESSSHQARSALLESGCA